MSDSGTLRTSVVIPTYKRCTGLPGVLAPLLAESATHEVVVVVDGCCDGSLELLERFAREDPRVIGVLQENQGETAARATGIGRATGEIVLLIDDDVQAESGLVERHAARHVEQEGLVVVGYMPVVGDTRGTEALTSRLYSSAYEQSCRLWEQDPRTILTTLWAGNFSMRRVDALRIGEVGTQRFDSHGDRDFGLRCRAAGLDAVFDRTLRARHHYSRTLAGLVRDARAQGRESTRLYMAYPDALGPLRRDRFRVLLPDPFAALVEFCRRPGATSIVSRALIGLVHIAGALHLRRTQERVALLLMRIERQRGAIEFRRQRLPIAHSRARDALQRGTHRIDTSDEPQR